MMDRDAIWIAVVSDREGRLLQGRPVASGPRGRMRLVAVETFRNPWIELARDDPQPAAYQPIDRRAELFARYAVDLSKWLEVHVKKKGIEAVEVFSPLRLEALLRSMCPQSLMGKVRHHRFDRAGSPLSELEREPKLLDLLERSAGDDSRRAS